MPMKPFVNLLTPEFWLIPAFHKVGEVIYAVCEKFIIHKAIIIELTTTLLLQAKESPFGILTPLLFEFRKARYAHIVGSIAM